MPNSNTLGSLLSKFTTNCLLVGRAETPSCSSDSLCLVDEISLGLPPPTPLEEAVELKFTFLPQKPTALCRDKEKTAKTGSVGADRGDYCGTRPRLVFVVACSESEGGGR